MSFRESVPYLLGELGLASFMVLFGLGYWASGFWAETVACFGVAVLAWVFAYDIARKVDV